MLIFPSLKRRDNLDVVFGDKIAEGKLAIDKHGQGRRLHPSDGKLLIIEK
jgi:hypothetical protein